MTTLTQRPRPVPFEWKVVNPYTPVQMAWVDKETTGLDPDINVPLEIGVVLTDKWGRTHSWLRSFIMTDDWEDQLDNAEPIVKEMHDKNGLRRDLEQIEALHPDWATLLAPSEVDALVYNFLFEQAGAPGKMELSGSTINFDRNFLQRYLGHTCDWFHYRNIDVTTLKNVCRLLNPPVYRAMPQVPADQKAHRPIEDIMQSIAEYQFLKDNFLYEA